MVTPYAGFAGLGSMGRPMAANLHRAGLLAAVWNRTSERARAFAADTEVPVAPDLVELAGACRVVVTCVSADEDLLEVVEQMLPGLGRATILVHCATVRPYTARAAAVRGATRGAGFLDCPVSGGTEGAENASLSMMVGGNDDLLAAARPVLEAMATRILHMGPAGAGQATKAVNQVAVAGVNQAVSEAMAFARALDLPLEAVTEALSGGAADSWFLRRRAPNMIRGRYPLGFKVALHDKDLAICQALAESMGVQLPVVEMTRVHYRRLREQGHGDEDVSALFRVKAAAFAKAGGRGKGSKDGD
jgi:3-hydroxyisobutyrate dehydrogenase